MIGDGLNSLIPPHQNEFGTGQASGNPEDDKTPAVQAQNNQTTSVQSAGASSPVAASQPAETSAAPEESGHAAEDFKEFFDSIKEPAVIGGKTSASAGDYDDGQKQEFHHTVYHKRPILSQAVFLIEVDKIKPNPFQPRKNFDEDALKDLANSIREHGIIQPLVVSKIESDTEGGTSVEYQLIAGERRLKAAKMAGLEKVPVIVRQIDGKANQLELAIIENLQRENLDSVETARSYARLQDEFGMTQREIALRLGKSREVVANTLRLLSLPTEYQTALSKGQINESQARLLLSVDSLIAQKQLFEEIISNNLTVREIRNRVKAIQNSEASNAPASAGQLSRQDIEMKNIENKLKEFLGADVKIEKRGDAGKIVISFYSPEEVYGLMHKINPNDQTL